MSNDTTYNGWRNYETWNCKLWLDNDEGACNYWRETAEQALQDAIDNDEPDVRAEAAANLAHQLQDEIETAAQDLLDNSKAGASMLTDLLNSAVGRIDFREIAESYIGDIDLYSAGYNMPGCLPDSNPALFVSFDDACEYVADAIERITDEMIGASQADVDRINALADDARAQKAPFSTPSIDGYIYFVSKI